MPPVPKPKRQRTQHYFRAWREFRGLSQEQVAERINMSRENYGRIENGKLPYNQDVLEMCAVAFGCSPTDLIERDPIVETMADKLRSLLQSASPEAQKSILDYAEFTLKIKR